MSEAAPPRSPPSQPPRLLFASHLLIPLKVSRSDHPTSPAMRRSWHHRRLAALAHDQLPKKHIATSTAVQRRSVNQGNAVNTTCKLLRCPPSTERATRRPRADLSTEVGGASDEPSSVRRESSRASLHTSSESHSVECRYMGALCVDLATTPGSVPGHDPLRLSCDSGKSPFNGGGALVMSLDSLAGWSSAQRARSPSTAPRCRPRGSSRLGDFKSFSALFQGGEGGGLHPGAAEGLLAR